MKHSIHYAISLIFLCTLAACHSKPVNVAKAADPIPDSVLKNVQTAVVAEAGVADVIKLNGKVIPNEKLQAKVFSLVSGKINSVSVELGDYVKKGQSLAILQSTEVAGVTNDLAVSASNVAMAKKNMESTRELYQDHLATEKDYISTQLEYNKALAEQNRAKQVAAITGGKNSITELRAPISGYVTEKNITNNSQIRADNNTNLFTIADLSNVWIIANVYEVDINNIHIGDAVKVNTLSNPDKDYSGTIDKIYNVLDPSTRTMKVRISMVNNNNELKPEMFATVTVNRKTQQSMLSVPSTALVLDNSKYYVIVQKPDHSLQVQEVQIFKRVGNTTFISGVSEGERVVTNSQVFLFEALNTK